MSESPITTAADLKAEKAAIRVKRQAFVGSVWSQFERTMRRTMTDYLAARTAGVSREDAIKGIAEELRGVWPKQTSKFQPICDACEDTGWQEKLCWHELRCCDRHAQKHPAFEHRYVLACHCATGDRHRPRVYTPEDALASVGRAAPKKKRGWRQVGA